MERTAEMNNRKAFTLIEILIVLAIIALLVGILLPSITMVRRQAQETAQKAQFAAIDMALDAFKQDYGDYPPSDRLDTSPAPGPYPYCGTQKLTEALLGMDLRGFHPQSVWSRYGLSATFTNLYDSSTLNNRRGPYLEVAKTGVFHLDIKSAGANDGLYNPLNISFFGNFFDRSQPNFVICDVFGVKKISIITTSPTGGSVTTTKWAGSPILYHKANTTSKIFMANPTPPTESIYDQGDNMGILQLGKLPDGYTGVGNENYHRLVDPVFNPAYGTIFYNPGYKIVDEKVPPTPAGTYWPNRPDTYILISAGADHDFGTKDDIFNF